MPRVHTVQNNRKEQTCRKCSKVIGVGEGYKHWSFRYGGKVTRCLQCPHPRQSELTQSGYLQQVYGAQENFEDNIADIKIEDGNWETFRDDVASQVDDVRQVAEDVRDEYQDALDQWEHGNSMLEEKVEAAECWADELDGARSDIESMEPDLPDELDEDASDEDREEYEGELESALTSFSEEVISRAEDAVNNCDL